jgi:hypothetical protein
MNSPLDVLTLVFYILPAVLSLLPLYIEQFIKYQHRQADSILLLFFQSILCFVPLFNIIWAIIVIDETHKLIDIKVKIDD